MGRIHLVTFSNDLEKYPIAKFQEALKNGYIDVLHVWDAQRIAATDLYKHNRELFTGGRGYGYWIWKPYIILQELQDLPEEDILIYSDAGRNTDLYFYDYAITVRPNILFDITHDFVSWAWGASIGKWCKRDVFVAMNCDTPDYHRAEKVSGFFSIRNTVISRNLLTEWLYWCTQRAISGNRSQWLIVDSANIFSDPDDPNKPIDNLPGYCGHRHDLSILSILLCKMDIPVRPGYLYYMNRFIDDVVELEVLIAKYNGADQNAIYRQALQNLYIDEYHIAYLQFTTIINLTPVLSWYYTPNIVYQNIIYYIMLCLFKLSVQNLRNHNMDMVKRYLEQIGKFLDISFIDGDLRVREFKAVFYKFVHSVIGGSDPTLLERSDRYFSQMPLLN